MENIESANVSTNSQVNITQDGQVTKTIITAGTGNCPVVGSKCHGLF
jgi:hypothetical protein